MAILESLKKKTGRSASELVREALRLLNAHTTGPKRRVSALELAGAYVGKYASGLRDLSTNPKYMEGFGE